jgi:Ca2+-binding EF-hand superfamily protein
MELYTEENMIIREHIAHHPLIVEKLTSMWDKLVLEYYDDDHTGNLDRAGYVRFHYALCKAIQRDGVTDEEHVKLAKKEFAEDTKAFGGVFNHDAFCVSLFELVDMWCETTELQEYLDFFDFIFIKVYEWQGKQNFLNRHTFKETPNAAKTPRYLRSTEGWRKLDAHQHGHHHQGGGVDGVREGGGARFDESSVDELKMAFLRVCDKKYEVDRLRFAWALAHLGVAPPGLIVNRLFDLVDKSRRGWVSWRSFVRVCAFLRGRSSRKRAVKFAFQIFDMDNSRTIAPYEIKLAIKPLEREVAGRTASGRKGGNGKGGNGGAGGEDAALVAKLHLIVDGAFKDVQSTGGRLDIKAFSKVVDRHPELVTEVILMALPPRKEKAGEEDWESSEDDYEDDEDEDEDEDDEDEDDEEDDDEEDEKNGEVAAPVSRGQRMKTQHECGGGGGGGKEKGEEEEGGEEGGNWKHDWKKKRTPTTEEERGQREIGGEIGEPNRDDGVGNGTGGGKERGKDDAARRTSRVYASVGGRTTVVEIETTASVDSQGVSGRTSGGKSLMFSDSFVGRINGMY